MQKRRRSQAQRPGRHLPSDLPESERDTPRHALKRLLEVDSTPLEFHVGRPVARRCTAAYRGDQAIAQPQAVVGAGGSRLVGVARVVQGAEQPVAAAVTREQPPRTIRAVRGGGQTNHEQARARVAEVGYRTAPIGFVTVRRAAGPRDGLTVPTQPRAAVAGNHPRVLPAQPVGRFAGRG